MRIWDLPVEKLCRKHLLGEHLELHAIWSVIVNDKSGYSKHPETIRWKGKLRALNKRHELQVKEMEKRGYNHNSPLIGIVSGDSEQNKYIDSPEEQIRILREKCNDCNV